MNFQKPSPSSLPSCVEYPLNAHTERLYLRNIKTEKIDISDTEDKGREETLCRVAEML